MATSCPADLDTIRLRAEISTIYARVAADPTGEFHFHRGPEYAATRLNYDAAELSRLPRAVTESFAGVGNPHCIGPLPADATVVDIGSGAGTDLLGCDAGAVGARHGAVADLVAPARAGVVDCRHLCCVCFQRVVTALPVRRWSANAG